MGVPINYKPLISEAFFFAKNFLVWFGLLCMPNFLGVTLGQKIYRTLGTVTISPEDFESKALTILNNLAAKNP